ncbi:carbohydrate deacetylase [Vibrio sp. DW001]|uniref:carbohydrate deacetylase n=1 Tax=Vibrio sp. DW001 TaxID=2912315 RepID=UPI0023B1DCC0|nr:carbohydrate deacetylase [Vibrio sp. DW001]WED25747.1 carbohydrate deacetylase [Vibrio sp. DW001]
MKLKVINNADDFGYSNSVNYGIIDAHRDGVLTSTTIMANMPGFDHAVKIAKEYPCLGIGVHCTLTCGRPLLNSHKTLVNSSGYFHTLSNYKKDSFRVDSNEVYAEFKSQIEMVILSGIEPTHLDSHHHIHHYKDNMKIIIQLAKEYNLPVRNSNTEELKKQGTKVKYVLETAKIGSTVFEDNKIKCNDVLIGPYIRRENKIKNSKDLEQAIVDEIIESLEESKGLNVVEVMWHPAYMDKSIMESSSLNISRIYELQALLNEDLRKYLSIHCNLCTFREI